MSAQGLGSRAIIGEFYRILEDMPGLAWIDGLSMLFESNQASEEYKWLGMAPAMREWIGGRNAKGLRENGITIVNKTFEGTLRVHVDDLRRDKTGQVMVRIAELAERTNAHWASLLSTLIKNGETGICYDGQFFFDTDHSEGSSGSQSNDLVFDISDDSMVGSDLRGTATNPSPHTIQACILKAVQAIYGFKDDQAEPMNESARQFVAMVPVPYLASAIAAVTLPTLTQGQTNIIPANREFTIVPVSNPRLDWTTKLAVFRADGRVKPFVRQNEEGVTIQAVAEGSEHETMNNEHLYGVKAIRNVGYGYWQHAALVTLQA